MSDFTSQVVFTYMAVASIASALLAITRRNPVHAILWVLALFLHVAAIFLLLGAEFLAAVQIIVYAGAILVFYLLVLMLLDLPEEASVPRFSSHWGVAGAAGLGLAALAWLARLGGSSSPPAGADGLAAEGAVPWGRLSEVGGTLFGQFALPFEIASLILLAAIVGAVMLSKKPGDS